MTVAERIQKNREMEARIADKKVTASRFGLSNTSRQELKLVRQIAKAGKQILDEGGMDPKMFHKLMMGLLK